MRQWKERLDYENTPSNSLHWHQKKQGGKLRGGSNRGQGVGRGEERGDHKNDDCQGCSTATSHPPPSNYNKTPLSSFQFSSILIAAVCLSACLAASTRRALRRRGIINYDEFILPCAPSRGATLALVFTEQFYWQDNDHTNMVGKDSSERDVMWRKRWKAHCTSSEHRLNTCMPMPHHSLVAKSMNTSSRPLFDLADVSKCEAPTDLAYLNNTT